MDKKQYTKIKAGTYFHADHNGVKKIQATISNWCFLFVYHRAEVKAAFFCEVTGQALYAMAKTKNKKTKRNGLTIILKGRVYCSHTDIL